MASDGGYRCDKISWQAVKRCRHYHNHYHYHPSVSKSNHGEGGVVRKKKEANDRSDRYRTFPTMPFCRNVFPTSAEIEPK